MNEREHRTDTDTVPTSVRFPREVHNRLRVEAARQDRSISWLVLHYVRRGLDANEGERS